MDEINIESVDEINDLYVCDKCYEPYYKINICLLCNKAYCNKCIDAVNVTKIGRRNSLFLCITCV